MVAARNVAILNDVASVESAWAADVLEWYVPNTVTKLRHFLDTGVYRHDVEGLLD